VEYGDPEDVFDRPLHPYTKTLLDAVPVPDPEKERHRDIASLSGEPPSPTAIIAGLSVPLALSLRHGRLPD
jgi:oligopeptide/dipeptide ABC transporter ATP-binding protein